MSFFLINSSIGRKLVMSISGMFLILFLTFHMCMNLVAIISPEGYNTVCEFLGANWYALVGTAILAGGFIIHILFGLLLSIENRRARGNDRYAVTARPKTVEWASQNMLALGIVILALLGLHLYHFWAKMQFVELQAMAGVEVDSNLLANATNGYGLIEQTFSSPVVVALYLVMLCALWFHISHGFWSSLQSMGLSNSVWLKRIQVISMVYATLLVAGFAVVVIFFFVKSIL
ncbi:MAG: succinate dehydrogenase cytochrome b subunit [Paludibacteraceae bacterium]|nr:succinate dehydrogenase cytochrome b subunit [Paludibacteraceae bacterium]